MTEGPEREMPDAVETDAAALSSSEELDEEELGVDPLERGVEPTERWAEADHYGMTPTEQRRGEPLEDRLRQEQRDTTAEDIADTGELGDTEIAQGDMDELSSIEEPPRDSADRAGGSVADSLRDPEER